MRRLSSWVVAASALAIGAVGMPAVAAGPQVRAVGQLHAGSAIAMKVPWTSELTATEAPNGAVFYAPAPVIGAKGAVLHRAAAEVVRVIDATKPAAVAEHTPNPVLALAADSHHLYAVTTKQVLEYSRSTGALSHSWSLPQTSTYASVSVTPKWLYVSSVSESDFSGFEFSTVQAINLNSLAVNTVTNHAGGSGIAARGNHVFYGLQRGYIVKGTATGPKNKGPRSPKTGITVVGFFGSRLLTVGSTSDGTHGIMYLIDTATMHSEFSREIASPLAFDVVSTPTGAVYSNSTCFRLFPASKCHSTNSGVLGDQVSRLALLTGVQSDSVGLTNVDFLLGPKPAAVVATGGVYRLVRIK